MLLYISIYIKKLIAKNNINIITHKFKYIFIFYIILLNNNYNYKYTYFLLYFLLWIVYLFISGVFDREYTLALEKLTEKEEKLLCKIDAPPSMMSVFCRHYFKQLNV